MPSLSTHVLDLYHGAPASSVKIDVYFQQADGPWQHIKTVETNSDGRCDEPLVTEATCQPGTYELVFHIDAYFAAKSVTLPNPNFLTTVPVRFNNNINWVIIWFYGFCRPDMENICL